MAPGKIKKAIGAVKDKTSIGLAMVVSSDMVSDLGIAIIKATCHNDSPPHERHIRSILCLTAWSKALMATCVAKIGKRLDKTKNWIVAVKTLMLVHRLLTDGDPTFHSQIFSARRRGTYHFLNMSGFKDLSGGSNYWDFSAFVRTYARYLDEQLHFRLLGKNDDDALNDTPVNEMKTDRVFARVDRLKKLLDRFLACKPTGAAMRSKIVDVALNLLLKESFHTFLDMREVTSTLADRFMSLEIQDMMKVYENFSHVSRLYDELDIFYEWCKSAGIMRSSNFPTIEKIPKSQLNMMEDLIRQKAELIQKKKGPGDLIAERENTKEVKQDECAEDTSKETNKTQEIGDLLNLDDDDDDILSKQETGHSMAMVLFNTTNSTWEAFKDDSPGNPKWEAFKETSTYEQYVPASAYQCGNASKTVALPAPQAGSRSNSFPSKTDPFVVPVPVAYVQMSEMERRQRLLADDRLYWEQRQYANGIGIGNVHQQYPYQYATGSYARAW